MKLHYTDIQKITLRDILVSAGLTTRQVEDVFLLLRFKPERVQLAFYYRACGNTFDEIGSFLGVTKKQAWKYINENCIDLNNYVDFLCTKKG